MAVKIPREREKDVLETENQRLLTRKWKETGAGRRGMLRKKNKTSNTEMYVFSTIDCEESKRRRSSPEREAQSSHALLSLSLLRSSLRFCLYWYFLFLVSLLTGNEDEAVKEVKWKERESEHKGIPKREEWSKRRRRRKKQNDWERKVKGWQRIHTQDTRNGDEGMKQVFQEREKKHRNDMTRKFLSQRPFVASEGKGNGSKWPSRQKRRPEKRLVYSFCITTSFTALSLWTKKNQKKKKNRYLFSHTYPLIFILECLSLFVSLLFKTCLDDTCKRFRQRMKERKLLRQTIFKSKH